MITGIRVNGNTYDAQSTKVICMNASDSIVHVTSGKYAYEVQTGTPLDVQGNTVSIGADISVKQSISGSDSSPQQQQTYLKTINGIYPDEYGHILLLGHYCTSLTDRTDMSDEASAPEGSNQITVYDGCYACDDCAQTMQLQFMLQDVLLWNIGLKDCLIHYQPAAARLWQQLLQKYTLQLQGCGKSQTLQEGYRQRQIGKAVKLLYQYKATVAMWNYLVFTRARSLQVINAIQDYSGFVIQCKRIIDLCDSQQDAPGPVALYMHADLQSGQLPNMLASIGYNMRLFVAPVKQNTYIQYGKDTGSLGGDLDTANLTTTAVVYQGQNSIGVDMRIQFNPKQKCRAVFSGSYKILPVVTDVAGDVQIGLNQYIQLRFQSSDINMQQQTLLNRWRIDVGWQYSVGDMSIDYDSSIQTTYFTSAYCKHPQDSDST